MFQARFTDAYQPGATVYFPVVQECDGAVEEWTQVPAAGEDPHSLEIARAGREGRGRHCGRADR